MLEARRIGRSAAHAAFAARRGLRLLDPADAAPLAAEITRLSLQFPGEHCTECAAPDCHDTCDLFERGGTGRCRRLEDGIVVRRCRTGDIPYWLEALFRPWGEIMCVGNAWCVSRRAYRLTAPLIPVLGRLSVLLQSAFRFLPARRQWKVTDRIRGLGNRVPRLLNRMAPAGSGGPAKALVGIIGNPHSETIRAEISVSGFGASQGGRSFQRVVCLAPGWQFFSIPVSDIEPVIDFRRLFRIILLPLIESKTLLQILYFGLAAFDPAAGAGRPPVGSRTSGTTASLSGPAGGGRSASSATAARKVKLLVLDLDNTLWDGVLIENPQADYALRPGVRAALEQLDQRGILLSIASKNNFEEARGVLEKLGIWHLFLYPQINWAPKSEAVRAIVRNLNIGMDTVAFVDDAEFERAEVAAALPEVRTWDAVALPSLPAREEFSVPVTEESRGRRGLYQAEESRQAEFHGSQLDYDEFLRSCRIRIVLGALNGANLERVYELAQRTNQLNFSGARYTREDLTRAAAAGDTIPVVMKCDDRFGNYGIVGFSLLAAAGSALEMSDLMFSCRIQGKRIEHAYLAHLVAVGRQCGLERLVCRYTRTARNSPAARVFDELGFSREVGPGSREVHSADCRQVRLPRFPAEVVDEIGLARRLSGRTDL